MKYEIVTLLTPKIRFLMLMLCSISWSPLSLESGRKGRVYFCHSSWTHTPEQLGIFMWNLKHANKTSLETFWRTQVWNLKYLCLTIALIFFFFFNFLLLFLRSTSCVWNKISIKYVINICIKTKHILLELKVPWVPFLKLQPCWYQCSIQQFFGGAGFSTSIARRKTVVQPGSLGQRCKPSPVGSRGETL